MLEQNIIQWNCNGFYAHIEEIKNIINSHNPIALCIQETRFAALHTPKCSGYKPYFKNYVDNLNASGGVAIFVKADIHCTEIVLNTNLQAIAIRMNYPKKITLCNLYIPPDESITPATLTHLLNQLERPYILVGDFNAHNPLWGSTSYNPKGRTVEDVVNNSDLVLLNNGQNTRFNKHTGGFSAIDLSFTNSSLAMQIEWSVYNDLCNSDHFPIFVTFVNSTHVQTRRPKWLLDKANWPDYVNALSELPLSPDENSIHINELVYNFSSNVYNAALKTIPRTAEHVGRRSVPWWSDEIGVAIKIRKKRLSLFRRFPTVHNLNEFKKAEAKSKYLMKQAKRVQWQTYVSSINEQTPIRECWNKIRSISGINRCNNIKSLQVSDILYTDPLEISNILGKNYELISSDTNYTPEFQRIKSREEQEMLNFDETTGNDYNIAITEHELNLSLETGAGTSPGHDHISYEMIRNLPSNYHHHLLTIFNKIWLEDCFPDTWKLAHIIPISKPGKNLLDPSSYRAISLTSCLCKLLERIVSKRLVNYLDVHNCISNNQAGFRKEYSTMDHLVSLENIIQLAFAKREMVTRDGYLL